MHRSGVLFLLLLFSLSHHALSQRTSISGIVLDEERGTPLANANVFLANTPFGTSTGRDGWYRITGIPPGMYALVVSLVGYEVRTQQLHVATADSLHLIFYLHPRPVQTDEVQSVGVTPAEWKKLLIPFVREFIGQSPNADQTRLLNPEVINLHGDSITHMLLASSDSLVRVENNALGYRLEIVLAKFKWNTGEGGGQYLVYPQFEEMVPATSGIKDEWDMNRRHSFKGSLRHFLRSLVSGTLEQQGFTVHCGNFAALRNGLHRPITHDEFSLAYAKDLALWRFSFDGWLRVEYRGRRRRTSFITLNGGTAVLDDRGGLTAPLCLETVGDWFEDRVAEMLPLNYQE
jgi:hypothetical protein